MLSRVSDSTAFFMRYKPNKKASNVKFYILFENNTVFFCVLKKYLYICTVEMKQIITIKF